MNKKLITGSVLAAILMTGSAVGFASAQTATTPVAVSATQAIEIALAEVPGEVQEVDLDRDDGQQVYEVEIVNADGVEMEVEVDAETGEVLEVEADDDDCRDKRGKDRRGDRS